MAANPRTAIKATIRRASARARADMDRLDREAMGDLLRIYQDAAADIAREIEGAARGGPTVRLDVLQGLLVQVRDRLRTLEAARNGQLELRLDQAARIGAGAFRAVSVDDVAAAHRATQFVQQFVAEDGLQLSDRIWRIDRGTRDAITNAIESAVIQGHSASRAVDDLLSRGQPVPSDLRNKISAAAPGGMARASRAALVDQDGAYGRAERLFRTELNRAHVEAYRATGLQLDGVVGTRFLLSPNHPRADICDMHAAVNRYGLGAGVYPPGRSPLPAHPNTLSYEEVVFDDEVDDVDRATQQDRLAWLGQQDPLTQELILGSRAKRRALELGLLRESQIGTPWKVLREHFRRRGIDIDALERPRAPPVPRARRGTRPERDPGTTSAGRDYVREQGLRTGHEFAYGVDTQTREVLIRKTSNHPSMVSFTPAEVAAMSDPARAIDLVHNHPRSTPLSREDYLMSSLSGVRRIEAIAHDGGIYQGSLRAGTEAFQVAVGLAGDVLRGELLPVVRAGRLEADDAAMVHGHAMWHALQRLELVDYRVVKTGPGLQRAIDRFGERNLRKLIDDAVTALRGDD